MSILLRIVFGCALLVMATELIAAPFEWLWPYSLGGKTHWRGDKQTPYVSLTFDDGPSAYTTEVLDVLKEYSVSGTFFVIGRQVEKYPELAKRIVDEGHDIGNHTYSFVAPRGWNPKKLFLQIPESQVSRTQNSVHVATGTAPRFFRSPGGSMGRVLLNSVHSYGLVVVNGTLPFPDPETSADEQLAVVLRTVGNGVIIILHDGDDKNPESDRPKAVVEVLPHLIEAVRKQGYEIVPLHQLLGKGPR